MSHQDPSKAGPTVLHFLSDGADTLPAQVSDETQFSQVMYMILKMTNRGQKSDQILDYVFSTLRTLIPFERIGIGLLENNGENLRLEWVKSTLPIKNLDRNHYGSLDKSSLSRIITEQRPRIINDLQEYLAQNPDSLSTKLALEDGIMSNLTCPLFIDGRVIGVIFFSSSVPSAFDPNHAALFWRISEGLSLIIEQSLAKKTIEDSKLKERYFRDALHDLKNPLTVILGTLELVAKKEWFQQMGDTEKSVYKILKRNCDAMVKLVNEVVYSDKRQLKPKMTSLDEFLRAVLADAKVLALKKKIQIKLNKDEDLPPKLLFDPLNIKEVLENLITNAIKFSEENTMVNINVQRDIDRNRINFEVKDQGQGIVEAELPKLFKEFGQTSAKPTAGESSKGLGLYNVKNLVKLHGGNVWAKSQSGRGSTFGFWIPEKGSGL